MSDAAKVRLPEITLEDGTSAFECLARTSQLIEFLTGGGAGPALEAFRSFLYTECHEEFHSTESIETDLEFFKEQILLKIELEPLE